MFLKPVYTVFKNIFSPYQPKSQILFNKKEAITGHCKKDRFMMLENKLLNDESLELNAVISRKISQVSTHCIHKITESSPGPNQSKSQILFHKKRPSQDFVA